MTDQTVRPDNVGLHNSMDVNAQNTHIQRREINNAGFHAPENMSQDQYEELHNSALLSPVLHEQQLQFQQQLLHLKQQQQLQQQLLLQHFQQQQQQLAEQHEKQLQERIKVNEYLEQQKKIEEEQKVEKERKEKEKLESLKKKEKHEQSAIASSEVKQRLQEFVLNKKQREAAASSANSSPPNFRQWSRQHASLDQASPPSTSAISPSSRHLFLGKYDDDFPLRKTASEPNLKVRSVLKQKVIERRSSPLLRRKDKGPIPVKRRPPLTMDGPNSRQDSGSGSPPSNIPSLHSSNGSTPIQEEPGASPFHPLNQGSVGDLTLYSSPSLPNISLGRPPGAAGSPEGCKTAAAVVSEAQVRAMAAARLGMPLTSHMLHSSLPFYPTLPVIDGEFSPPTSPDYIQQQMKTLEQGSNSGSTSTVNGSISVFPSLYPPGGVITDVQVAHARLHRPFYFRNIHRPLGRTQSAPLPLGHPLLQPQGVILSPQQSEQLARERQLLEQQQQHNLLKQHIRKTVLTRAGSKNQVENVEEETEAAVAQEMKDSEAASGQPEVIDLTEGKEIREGDIGSELAKQQREREAFLQQQRDIMMKHNLPVSEDSAFIPRHHLIRPLSRALSSPHVTLGSSGSPQETQMAPRHTYTTGIVYDSLMLKHQCICGENYHHPEHGGRLQSIWARLQETNLIARCERLRSRKATLEEIQSCHSEAYALLFGTNPLNRQKLDISKLADLPIKSFVMLPCGGVGVDSDTTWNELHTASAARMAAGCCIELATKVATNEIKNGFAIVRPPGHHAEYQQAMGFCFFNSVAIAAKQLRQRLKLEKILIVDWDVHHGNGIQQIFYDDPHVLYISLHRHDEGNFFPGTGDPHEVGVEDGIGFNVNISWSGSVTSPMGDADYLAAFRTVVMPIAKDFDPEIVLVAAGFDAAYGHPPQLGGYCLTPACFGFMTKQLLQLAKGKLVLVLEGGYDLPSICDCSQECVAALLGDEGTPVSNEELTRKPSQVAIEVLQRTIAIQVPHWPCIKRTAHLVGLTYLEAQQKEKEEVETVSALASLSMAVPQGQMQSPKTDASSNDQEEPMDQDSDK